MFGHPIPGKARRALEQRNIERGRRLGIRIVRDDRDCGIGRDLVAPGVGGVNPERNGGARHKMRIRSRSGRRSGLESDIPWISGFAIHEDPQEP